MAVPYPETFVTDSRALYSQISFHLIFVSFGGLTVHLLLRCAMSLTPACLRRQGKNHEGSAPPQIRGRSYPTIQPCSSPASSSAFPSNHHRLATSTSTSLTSADSPDLRETKLKPQRHRPPRLSHDHRPICQHTSSLSIAVTIPRCPQRGQLRHARIPGVSPHDTELDDYRTGSEADRIQSQCHPRRPLRRR